MRLAIKEALERTGKSKSGLAYALGVSNSAVTAILAGTREIRARELPVIIKYFGLDLVPVVGRILQGGWVERVAESKDNVELPIYITPHHPDEASRPMQAYEVTGDFMMPRYDDGDAIIVWSDQRQKLPHYFGQEAIVRCADGKMWLRYLRRGSATTARLTSFNARDVITARIEWVGEICFTVRSFQRRTRPRR